MTKRKKIALEALDAFEREQQDRANREVELRRAAALELGVVVMEAGGSRLGIDALRHAVTTAVASLPAPAEGGLGKERQHG